MKFLISDTILRAAGETRDEIDLLLHDLANAEGIAAGPSVHGEVDAIALSPRRGGILLTLLDTSERPVQMFPLQTTTLEPHFDVYARTIENPSGMDDLTSLRGFEALDYGKKVAHDQAGEAIQELVGPVLSLDLESARRFFSLLFVLVSSASEDTRKKHRRHR